MFSVYLSLKAIECGHLPVDILDALPCKFVDGSVICEVIIYLYNYFSVHEACMGWERS